MDLVVVAMQDEEGWTEHEHRAPSHPPSLACDRIDEAPVSDVEHEAVRERHLPRIRGLAAQDLTCEARLDRRLQIARLVDRDLNGTILLPDDRRAPAKGEGLVAIEG